MITESMITKYPHLHELMGEPGNAFLYGLTVHHTDAAEARAWVLEKLDERDVLHALPALEEALALPEGERVTYLTKRLGLGASDAEYWLSSMIRGVVRTWVAASRACGDGIVETWDSSYDLDRYLAATIAG